MAIFPTDARHELVDVVDHEGEGLAVREAHGDVPRALPLRYLAQRPRPLQVFDVAISSSSAIAAAANFLDQR